jgi:hypothetical protein
MTTSSAIENTTEAERRMPVLALSRHCRRLFPLGRLPLIGVMLAAAPALTTAYAYGQTAPAGTTELPLKQAPQPTAARISAADLMTRLYIFADDSMEGRKYLTAGNVKGTNYLAAELKKLGLEPAGDSGTYFQTLPYDAGKGEHPGRNVVAILRGTDPTLNQTYVVLGAHNDGQGIRSSVVPDHDLARTSKLMDERLERTVSDEGLRDSLRRTLVVDGDSLHRLRPARRDSIANGADDDGSGSVAVLEIAEALAKLPVKPKRSVLFVFHTGEEAGLLGAKYFTEHPTVPRDSIIAMVNLDMVGRGSREDTPEGGPDMLMAIGSRRLSSELGQLVEAVNAEKGHRLRLDYTWDAPTHPAGVYGASDHYEYAKRGIPVVFLFTGMRLDYHGVTDEPQYIDYPHLAKITKYVYDLTLALGSRPRRPVVDNPWQRQEPYRNYALQTRGEIIALFGELGLTGGQKRSLGQLVRAHDAQRSALIDSVGALPAGADTAVATRRLFRLAARHLGELRAALTREQQAIFDPGAKAWIARRAPDGYRVIAPGLTN